VGTVIGERPHVPYATIVERPRRVNNPDLKIRLDLGRLDWLLGGWTPWVWRQQRSLEAGVSNHAGVSGVPARVPGWAQGALRDADIIPDWNVGLEARACEWVESRHSELPCLPS